jgi:tRNA pseudouridine38-40 synthase
MKRAFRIAYDGRPFHGFQRQPDVPTVENELFAALATLDIYDPVSESRPTGYSAAGRTDAGVSAIAQTVTFECSEWCRPVVFDSELPRSIHVYASTEVTDSFHATHQASSRQYRYLLMESSLEAERARKAAMRLSGRHDFQNFSLDTTGTVRDVSITVESSPPFLVLSVVADGFPRQFVRRIATVIRGVASGMRDIDSIDTLLAGPVRGEHGVAPAPPEPLFLAAVEYPQCEFLIDSQAHSRAVEAIETQYQQDRLEAGVRAEIAESLRTRAADQ